MTAQFPATDKTYPFMLTLRVPADVDRTEFEPDALWSAKPVNGNLLVVQSVARVGDYLEGRTGAFIEAVTDVIADTQRFINLVVDQELIQR